MNKNPSLVQRLMADTPDFFKKLDFIGLVLIGLAVSLKGLIPAQYLAIGGTIGGTLTTMSKFAIKDSPLVTAQVNATDPAAAITVITDLANQGADLKTDLQQITQQVQQAAVPVNIPPPTV